jgi:hypothetical protein
MIARASIATPESDAKLRRKYRRLGNRARLNGVKREDCPVDGLIAQWWREGWDGIYAGTIKAQ